MKIVLVFSTANITILVYTKATQAFFLKGKTFCAVVQGDFHRITPSSQPLNGIKSGESTPKRDNDESQPLSAITSNRSQLLSGSGSNPSQAKSGNGTSYPAICTHHTLQCGTSHPAICTHRILRSIHIAPSNAAHRTLQSVHIASTNCTPCE